MGKSKRLFGMSDRVVVFEPKDLKSVIESLDVTPTQLANFVGLKPGTVRKWITEESTNMTLASLDMVTQRLLDSYRTRHIMSRPKSLPKRHALINPAFLKKEMDKRCVNVSFLVKHLGKRLSETYIKNLVNQKFSENGPMYLKYRMISDLILSIPVKTEEERNNFYRNSKEYNPDKDSDLIDDLGTPKLSDGKLWDFKEAQKIWLERDAEKLKNLPRVGHLTTLQKVTKKS